MGADGHIKIWRDDEVRAEFPDCDRLFGHLPTHYADMLDGTKYHHCYWGDGMWSDWRDEADWYTEDGSDLLPRMREFVKWLHAHGTHWEVWT